MANIQKGIRPVPISERWFVRVLVVTLFFFAASGISIVIPVSVADIGRWVGMVLAILMGFSLGRSSASNSGIDILIWAMMFVFFLSSVQSVAQNKSFMYLGVCALQIMLLTFLTRKLSVVSWRFVFAFLAALCVAVSFMALGGYATNPDQYTVQGRLAGLSNANNMGLVAMIGVIICTANFLLVRKSSIAKFKRFRIIFLIGAFGCFVAMILTGSRGALGGMLSGVLVVIFLTGKSSRFMLGLLFLIPLITLYNLMNANDLSELIQSKYDRGGSVDLLHTRRFVWNLAYAYFEQNPWLGKGYAVHDEFGNIIDGSGYYGMLASVGIIGTGIYLSISTWIVVSLISIGINSSFPSKAFAEWRVLLVMGGGVIVGLLVQGIGEPWMLGPGSLTHAIYWLSVGACLSGFMMLKRQMRLHNIHMNHS